MISRNSAFKIISHIVWAVPLCPWNNPRPVPALDNHLCVSRSIKTPCRWRKWNAWINCFIHSIDTRRLSQNRARVERTLIRFTANSKFASNLKNLSARKCSRMRSRDGVPACNGLPSCTTRCLPAKNTQEMGLLNVDRFRVGSGSNQSRCCTVIQRWPLTL